MSEMTLTQAVTVPQARKPLPYAIKSHTGDVAGGGKVGRGVNVKSGDPFLIHQDGRNQQALSLQAVAAAIYHGIVTREEIAALQAQADADAKVSKESKKEGGR